MADCRPQILVQMEEQSCECPRYALFLGVSSVWKTENATAIDQGASRNGPKRGTKIAAVALEFARTRLGSAPGKNNEFSLKNVGKMCYSRIT